jgi:hypothetical protein
MLRRKLEEAPEEIAALDSETAELWQWQFRSARFKIAPASPGPPQFKAETLRRTQTP